MPATLWSQEFIAIEWTAESISAAITTLPAELQLPVANSQTTAQKWEDWKKEGNSRELEASIDLEEIIFLDETAATLWDQIVGQTGSTDTLARTLYFTPERLPVNLQTQIKALKKDVKFYLTTAAILPSDNTIPMLHPLFMQLMVEIAAQLPLFNFSVRVDNASVSRKFFQQARLFTRPGTAREISQESQRIQIFYNLESIGNLLAWPQFPITNVPKHCSQWGLNPIINAMILKNAFTQPDHYPPTWYLHSLWVKLEASCNIEVFPAPGKSIVVLVETPSKTLNPLHSFLPLNIWTTSTAYKRNLGKMVTAWRKIHQ